MILLLWREEWWDGLSVGVLNPVVVCLSKYRDNVFDLFFELEMGSGWEKELFAFASYADIFYNDGPQEPEGHIFIVAFYTNPARF